MNSLSHVTALFSLKGLVTEQRLRASYLELVCWNAGLPFALAGSWVHWNFSVSPFMKKLCESFLRGTCSRISLAKILDSAPDFPSLLLCAPSVLSELGPQREVGCLS